jgi:hypothetical protein
MDEKQNTGGVVIMSPDGRWQWNGAQRVPATQPPRGGRSMIFWPVLGALITFAVLAAIVFAVYSSAREEQQRKREVEQYFNCYDDPNTGHRLAPEDRPYGCP